MKVYKVNAEPVNYGSWEIVGRGRSADMLAGDEPSDIFRELQDEDDDGEPNTVVDGLIDDLRDVWRIGRSAYAGHHNWIAVGNKEIGNDQVADASKNGHQPVQADPIGANQSDACITHSEQNEGVDRQIKLIPSWRQMKKCGRGTENEELRVLHSMKPEKRHGERNEF